MATLRLEIAEDPDSGRFYVELFYPSDAPLPLARTTPLYPSREAAEQAAIEKLRRAIPSQPLAATSAKGSY